MDWMTLSERKTTTAPRGAFARFRKEEDGGMIVFTLFMFVLVLWFGGMAVDLMRFETTRAKLQGTADRATLASADLDQTLPPREVCEDYFAKAGMLEFLDECTVQEGINYRRVSAAASVDMPLFFANLPNVFISPFVPTTSTLTVNAGAIAEERVTDVEVSLVLDVSGSMSRNNRIQNLRPAARDFVTTVLANNTNAPNGLITISMIPYSAVVNPGTLIEPYLNLNRSHLYSACPLFPDDMFSDTPLDLTRQFDHVAHFDPDWYSVDAEPIANPWCHVGDHNSIIVASSNESVLHQAITDLEPYGNTAIDMGMKWGVGLLDPSTRTIINGLAGGSGTNVPAAAAGRPQDFNQPDVLKVVVLMTDGSNTQQYDLHDRFKWGTSFIWFDLDDPNDALHTIDEEQTSVQYRGLGTPDNYWDDRFYWPRWPRKSERFRNYPRGFANQADYVNEMQNGPIFTASPGVGPTYDGNVRNASWQELYANWEHDRVNNELLNRARNDGAIPDWAGNSGAPHYIHYDDFYDADNAIDYSVVNDAEADARLSSLCAAARAKGIVIYTVAFEAPSGGQAALQDCASSPSHYFDVAGTDISEAFAAIASDIRALKLTR